MKLRPITLALLGAGIGKGLVNVVNSILGLIELSEYRQVLRIP